MSALTVAVIATAGFSPFHFSVPCIIFGQSMPQPDLFCVEICAEKTIISGVGKPEFLYKAILKRHMGALHAAFG